MKININQIPAEGLVLTDQIPASLLDLETDLVKLKENAIVNKKGANFICPYQKEDILRLGGENAGPTGN